MTKGFDKDAVAVNVRVARAKLGISQSELAEASGVCETTISFVECGKAEGVRFSTLSKLAKGLGCNLEDLIPM